MRQYGLYPSAVNQARAIHRQGQPMAAAVGALLEDTAGRPDGIALALILATGVEQFAAAVATEFGCRAGAVSEAVRARYPGQLAGDFPLTGGEAVALLLRQEQVAIAFAYAGTSELAVCDALARMPGLRLVNGRGDKESAFMAAGASLLRPHHGVAVLHGARGLTNAAGAVADVARNEIPTLFVVGLPSTGSARFLPPHGADGLIPTVGHFVKHWAVGQAVPAAEADRAAAAARFVAAFRLALRAARNRPRGPVLFGLPQDVAETSWIPWSLVADRGPAEHRPGVPADRLREAAGLLAGRRVVVLLDDYLLRYDGARPALAEFAARCGAPVLQARYRRGLMLYERLAAADVPWFVGWLDPMSPYHRKILDGAEVLVTLEDRNLYPRVVGDLPAGRKIAITSDSRAVLKNDYLTAGDVLLEGDVIDIVRGLSGLLPVPAVERPDGRRWYQELLLGQPDRSRPALSAAAAALRSGIAATIAGLLEECDLPVIVDDSSMFGGMICEEYDQLPARVRVFGDHGGFVGGGLGYATGLALGNPAATVLCLLGDQGFGNGLQGLVAAGQEQARLVYLVCNNGQAVSLVKQSAAAGPRWFDGGRHGHLQNPANVCAARLAAELGVTSAVVEFPVDRGLDVLRQSIAEFRARLTGALAGAGPHLIELRLPPLGDAWHGIWRTEGYERHAAAAGGAVAHR
jgi:acetolactate synthase-1/2/3 large subunit